MNNNGEKELQSPGETVDEKINAYGGWLRFFRIINSLYWLAGLLCILISPPLMLLLWNEEQQGVIDLLALLIEVTPGTVMSFLVWRTVKVELETTPNRIKSLMQVELMLHCMTAALLFYAHEQGYITDGPAPIVVSIIYYFAWASYFKRSKRVLAYYGSNTGKPAPPANLA